MGVALLLFIAAWAALLALAIVDYHYVDRAYDASCVVKVDNSTLKGTLERQTPLCRAIADYRDKQGLVFIAITGVLAILTVWGGAREG